jgi:release factor glutamine methyltransferase
MSPNDQLDFKDLRLAEVLKSVRRRLSRSSDTAGLDAQVLLAHLIGKSRAWVLAHTEESLDKNTAVHLEKAVQRLEKGEPLPYVLGRWEFFGLNFIVSPAVLIPRPETELLVETAIKWLKTSQAGRVLDVGTGSGCIAAAIAVNLPGVYITAVDLSREALLVASKNIKYHAVEDRVFLLQSDLLTPVASQYELICANLPYIREETLVNLKVSRQEPALALAGGEDGLNLIRRLFAQAAERLRPAGMLLAEIEAGQREAALKLADHYFPGTKTDVLKDLAGNDRLLKIEKEEKG